LAKVFGKSSFWEPSSSKVIVYLIKGPEIFGVASSIQVEDWNDETGKHYCIFFNVFVLLQVFNEINARKLKAEEVNVFEHFFNNPLFLLIIVATIIIQLTMVKYGGESMKTVELSTNENLLCIVLGSSTLLSGLIIKLILPKNLIICQYGVEIGEWKHYWAVVPDPREEAEKAEKAEKEE
jgi:magnesium-transporting ATPase (P-type)